MDNDTQEKKQSAPYISWKTFTSFIVNVHGKVPVQIDASILRNMSGTGRSQLLSALRFLDLIDADGTTKDSLKRLADSYNSDKWKTQLRDLIERAYGRVVNGLPLTGATPTMLRERFRNNGGVDGGTVDSALRFYLAALKEADIPYSQHLVMRQRAPKGSGGTRRRGGAKTTPEEDNGGDGVEPPEGTFEISFEVLGLDGSVFLPEEMSQERWAAISEYVNMVIGYRQKALAKI